MVHCSSTMEGWQYKGAFVIQFRPDTEVESGQIVGRVEHVTSSRSIRFQSVEELLLFIGTVLADLRHDADPGRRRNSPH